MLQVSRAKPGNPASIYIYDTHSLFILEANLHQLPVKLCSVPCLQYETAVAATAAATPIWMKAKLGLSLKSSRFTVPIDFRELQSKY